MTDEEKKELEEMDDETPVRDLSIQRINRLIGKGYTYKRIAEKLGTTEQVIKNTVYKNKLKKRKAEENKKKLGRPSGAKNKQTIAREMLIAEAKREEVFNALKPENAGRATAAVGHVMKCMAISQNVDRESIPSLYSGFMAYVQCCYECDFPLTIANACLSVGVPVSTLTGWRKGTIRAGDPEYKQFAETVTYVIQAGIEACMASGLMNPVTGIWWEKSHFGMIESSKAETVVADPLGERKTASEIKEQYGEMELPT